MAGRPRTSIGTYGTIHVKRVAKRRYRARTRVRDADGRLREVKATSSSGNQAKARLRDRIKMRDGYGASGLLAVSSPFALGLVHVLSCGVVYLGVGTSARRVLKAGPAASRVVSAISGVAMVVIGAVLVAERALA